MLGLFRIPMIQITEHFPMKRWETMQAFLAECYRPDLAMCALHHFSWQFQANSEIANVICGWDGDELLGICGYIPVRMHWGDLNRTWNAAWPINWIVKRNTPPGMGLLLFRKIERRFTIVIGSGASSEGRAFYQAMGGTYYDRIPRYLCVLNKAKSSPLFISEAAAGLTEWTAGNTGKSKLSVQDQFSIGNGEFTIFHKKTPAGKNTEPKVAPFNFYDSKQAEKLRQKFAQFYQPAWENYAGLRYGTIRSLDYLMWRYTEHPVFNYHLAIAGEPQKPVLCVYRTEWTTGDAAVPVTRMVEFFHGDDSDSIELARMLLDTVTLNLKKTGCAFIDFICSNRTFGQTLTDSGWIAEPADRLLLPVRLTPIERRLRYQNVEFIIPKELPRPALDDMYVTKSDADEDRPVSQNQIEIPQSKSRLTFVGL